MPRSMSGTPSRKKKGPAIRTPKQVSSEPATSCAQDRDVDGTQQQLECGTTIYGHGDFQRLLCCLVVLTLIVLHCHSQSSSLVARPVHHWCRPPSKFADLSTARWKNVGVPVDDAGSPSECLAYVRPGHQPNDTETIECDAWDYDAAQARRSARSFWNLVCHRTWLLSLANAVYMSGALFIVPVAGCLADTYGRKLVIASGFAVLLLSTVCTCLTRSYWLYLATRFVNSACASAVFVVALILLYEVVPLAYRVFYVGISCSLGVFLVDVFLLILAVFPLSWTVLQVVILSPTVLLVLAVCSVHESPAWLLVLCRVDEAEAVMLEAARVNDVHRVTARRAMQRLRDDINRSEGTLSPGVAPGAEARGARMAGVFVVTFTLMLGFYGLTWSSRMRKDATISIVSVVLSAPSYVVMYLALMTWGRLQFLVAAMRLLGGTCLLFAVAISANPRLVWRRPAGRGAVLRARPGSGQLPVRGRAVPDARAQHCTVRRLRVRPAGRHGRLGARHARGRGPRGPRLRRRRLGGVRWRRRARATARDEPRHHRRPQSERHRQGRARDDAGDAGRPRRGRSVV
ncbi:solute carrier family 22 member 6-like [Dermacentor albipictus]|uniref:solute carrier family 22 member 6-like n=1 Tax=Dermacentor albipictus TaxID=60249 RepID=UPI0038FC2BE7